jgi:hypothetical protein
MKKNLIVALVMVFVAFVYEPVIVMGQILASAQILRRRQRHLPNVIVCRSFRDGGLPMWKTQK